MDSNKQHFFSSQNTAKCLEAQKLEKNALAMYRIRQDDLMPINETLQAMTRTYTHLEMLNEARGTLKEALDISAGLYGQNSTDVLQCYH